MEFWFSEMHTPHVKLSIRVDRQLYSGKSEFQRIDVFDSPEFGRFLTLDGYMMLTEKDEFIYHEMITHVPMAVHPHVEKVLVIGAGDGGVIRELVQYQDLQHIDMVEIDPLVVEVCKKYLPKTACRLEDPRLTIHYEDGLKFIRSRQEEYDLIIVDSTDPFGPGEGLFTREFYGNCYKALKEDGILINQHESPFYPGGRRRLPAGPQKHCGELPHQQGVPGPYPHLPLGPLAVGFASKKYHPLKDLDETRWNMRGIPCRYYTTTLHKGAFYIPAYVEELLKHVEKEY